MMGDEQESEKKDRVFAMVSRVLSPRSQCAAVVVDKHGDCYYIKRNAKLKGSQVPKHVILSLKYVVSFDRPPKSGAAKTRLVSDLLDAREKRLGEYARMIRGAGQYSKWVFVDSFKARFEADKELITNVAPEGLPFICGLIHELKPTRTRLMALPKLDAFYGMTSEEIEFADCPWQIFRHNLWVHMPNYTVTPNYCKINDHKPYVMMQAKYVGAREGRPEDEIFYAFEKGIWVRRWHSSPERGDSGRKDFDALELGQVYRVKVAQSWLRNEYFELGARKSTRVFTADEERLIERMTKKVKSNAVLDLRMLHKKYNQFIC